MILRIRKTAIGAMTLFLAVLLVFSSCSEPENEIPGSVESIAVRVVDGTGARTITPDGNVNVSHYKITVHNNAENIHQESDYLSKGAMFSVSNVPAGEWYATVDAYVDRGESEYLKVASGSSQALQVAAGSSVTLTVTLDDTSLADTLSGDVTVTLKMPTALASDSTAFWYKYTITGLTDEGFGPYESSLTQGTVGADGTATITVDAETAGLVQGAYMFAITVQDAESDATVVREGVDVMRLLPGLAATGSLDLSTYESDQGFGIIITDSIGNLLTPELVDGQDVYTLDGQAGINTLEVTLSQPLSSGQEIEWYIDGTETAASSSDAGSGKYVLSFDSGNHIVTAIVRDTATAMAVGSISPFKVSLINASIEAESFTFEANDDVEGGSWTVTGTVEGFVQPDPAKFEIPSTYKGLPVTRIAGDAFCAREDISGTLIIPNSVKRIENGEYNRYDEIHNGAFSKCTNLTGLDLGDGIEYIGACAFDSCINMTGNLDLSENIETIEAHAFCSCGFTGDLTIPDSVTYLGNHCFSNCSFDGNLYLGKSLETIGSYSFKDCVSLKGSIELPEGLKTVGSFAFFNCTGLAGTLVIPESMDSVSNNGAFAKTGIESVDFNNKPLTEERGYQIEGGLHESYVSSYYGAFTDCKNLKEISIPSGSTSIGRKAFYGCTGLTGELKIPETVTSIGESAFEGCSGFTGNLVIPESITSIGNCVFWKCSGFNGSLVIPDSVTSIGEYAFSDCSSLTGELKIPETVTSIGRGAFSGCSGFTGEIKIPENVTSIESSIFYGCSSFTGNLNIPESITSIGYSAFEDCTGLNGNLVIPESVTSIGSSAFEDCSGFTGDLVIPESVTSIESSSFARCSFTGSLVIPDSVTSIGSSAFYGCSGFTGNLIIPDSVTSIGRSAFYECTGFESLKLSANLKEIGQAAFYNCTGLKGDITIPDGFTTFSVYSPYVEGTFENCSGITFISLPSTLELIAVRDLFKGCSSLTGTITIPATCVIEKPLVFTGCNAENLQVYHGETLLWPTT